ncbi:LysR family transcriptional regulator [Tianweitania sp.]|uniref:LysR family transcriptional regulator n=1 Tax=Tianweitania sp. TaxID=2021634 RepID=UPI00289E5E81|nr:LysR family transcriptional regulator [Tianweitania sp.]
MDQFAAIRVFLRTVEAGSMTRAAADIGMPKSTASKLLSQLEAHLGTKLLQRSTRAFALTAEGSEYYKRAGSLLANLHDIDADLRQRGSGLSGRIRIDLHSAMANTLLIPVLGQFRDRYPYIQEVVGISDRPVSLIGEGVDCVVRLGRMSDTSLIARTIYEDRLITCASPAYLEGHPPATDPRQLLEGHELVGYFSAATGEVKPMVFEKDGEHVQIGAAHVMANDSTGHVNMILNGLGVGQTFASTVKPHLASGALVRVLDDWTNGSEPISVLYPPAKRLNARVRAFIDWLVEHLEGGRR